VGHISRWVDPPHGGGGCPPYAYPIYLITYYNNLTHDTLEVKMFFNVLFIITLGRKEKSRAICPALIHGRPTIPVNLLSLKALRLLCATPAQVI